MPLDCKPYPAENGHAVLKRALEFGCMGPRQTIDDALLGLGKHGKDIGGSGTPVAVIGLSPCVLLFPHIPGGLLCLICGLALPQGQKAREILFGAAEPAKAARCRGLPTLCGR